MHSFELERFRFIKALNLIINDNAKMLMTKALTSLKKLTYAIKYLFLKLN